MYGNVSYAQTVRNLYSTFNMSAQSLNSSIEF